MKRIEHIAKLKSRKGYKHTKETLLKMRNAALGRKYSEETKEKITTPCRRSRRPLLIFLYIKKCNFIYKISGKPPLPPPFFLQRRGG
jgi:hypothetical protein